ncbi:pectate lyase [Sphingomonas floccifaciens]|uniref:Pectate lyase n=1 Tax=Sphingomonas floccifaciens TaxID=1844115 RepID=A0ABW4NBY9_9SPHN
MTFALMLASAGLPLEATQAGVVGTMTPASPLTRERIAEAQQDRDAWTAYLATSERLAAADRLALARERTDGRIPPAVRAGKGTASMPLDRDAAWYGTVDARRIADTIVSFQTPAGGWGKNADRSGPPRVRGQHYLSVEGEGGAVAQDARWDYAGTIDNGATTTEVRFLARVQAVAPGRAGDRWRKAIVRAVTYLQTAQFPNGGWPQVYPLQGGYHDAVTFNDNAMANVVTLLANVARRSGDFAFVSPALAARARSAHDRAIALILRTQVVVDGKPTGWGQQHDAVTLEPVGARNFEPAALSSSESAGILILLMGRPSPSPAAIRAVDAGVAWLTDRRIADAAFVRSPGHTGGLTPSVGSPPIWARFYSIPAFRPIFGDRDRRIVDDVGQISVERRNGYAWFSSDPAKALSLYRAWVRSRS